MRDLLYMMLHEFFGRWLRFGSIWRSAKVLLLEQRLRQVAQWLNKLSVVCTIVIA